MTGLVVNHLKLPKDTVERHYIVKEFLKILKLISKSKSLSAFKEGFSSDYFFMETIKGIHNVYQETTKGNRLIVILHG